MSPELGDEPINLQRLFLIFLPVVALMIVAFFFLPFTLQKIIAFSLLGLPVLMLLFDRPKWIFYILLLITFSNLDIFVTFRLFRFVLFLFIASFTVAMVNGRKIVVHDRMFVVLVAAFFLLAFQSIIVARDLDASLHVLNDFIKVLVNIAITVQFVRNRVEFRHFIIVMAIGILLNSFFPFIARPPTEFRNLALLWEQGVMRYEGYTLEANRFALYQNFFIPLLLFLIAIYPRPRFARSLLIVSLLATIFVLILSFSRGGFLTLLLMMVVLVIVGRRNRTVLTAGLLVIGLGVVFAPAVYWERIASLVQRGSWESKDYAIITRINAMKAALDMGFKHPVLGVGLHNCYYRIVSYQPVRMIVHNTFLQVFSETGIISFSVFIGIIVYNIRIARGLMRKLHDSEASQLGRILLIQQIVVLFNSMFIPVAYDRIFWYLLALPSIAKYAYREGAREMNRIGVNGSPHSIGRK